jgi:hypothetical protein
MATQKPTSKQERMPLHPVVVGVLRFRDKQELECPAEILTRIDSLKIGRAVHNFKAAATPQPPSPSASRQEGSWRTARHQRESHHSGNDRQGGGGGFRSNYNNNNNHHANNNNTWDRPLSIRRVKSDLSTNSFREEDSPSRRYKGTSSSSPASDVQSPVAFTGGRYVSKIVCDKNVDERIIGHIRAKLNKFSLMNYDSVKSFLEQIMNSGEVEFLSEFMDLLFTKAAAEEMYCALYSRLLSELVEKFPFLKTEINKIYSNFIAIFQEARDIPDQNSDDYKKFLESQEKKKYRQGYSHFLAEIYNKNLLPHDAMEITISHILTSLSKLEKDETNKLLVEEYLVSLSKIVQTLDIAKSELIPPYLVNMLDALKKTVAKPKSDTAGYTVKSRFKIMDIVDALPK